MSSRWILIVTLLAGLVAVPGLHAENVVLARIDGEPFTLHDLKIDFEHRHQGHMSLLGDAEVVRDFLDAALTRRLFIHEGRRLGLHEDEEIARLVKAERLRVGTRWLYRSEVEDRVSIGDAEIEAAMPSALVGHEIIRVRTHTRDEAERARDRILDGEAPEQVAREMSVARSRLRGGLEGVNWGAQPLAFETLIETTPEGEIAGPVETDEGWEIALVTAHKPIETETQEREITYVRNVLQRRETERVRSLFLDGLRERYHARIDTALLEPEILIPLIENPETREAEPRAIATFGGGSLSLADFAASIRARTFLLMLPAVQRRQAAQLLANQVDEALLELEAERRWEEAPEDVRAEVAWFENDMIFRALLDRVVFTDLEVRDDDLERYLAEHRDEYMQPAMVRFGIALLPSEEEALRMLRECAEGASFGTLARERSQDPATAARDGDAGWIAASQAIAPLRGAPFDSAVGETGGPIRLDEGWLVYTVQDRRDATPLPAEEARARARKRLQRMEGDRRMGSWEEQLRSVATIKVSDKGIRKASKILAEERAARNLDETPTQPGGAP